MINKLKGKASGFTIIEVLIVLAIAGLILTIVFVAVPQLQRNTRDNSRQSAANRTSTELGNFASNNGGVYPFRATGQTMADFSTRYITGFVELRNPSTGNNYSLSIPANGTADPTADQILIYPGMNCTGEDQAGTFVAAADTNNSKQYAVRVQLDRASTYYCTDNN